MAAEKDLNHFGEFLLELLEERGLTVADLARIISARPEAPKITEEDMLRIMSAEGEEFGELMAAFNAAVLREN